MKKLIPKFIFSVYHYLLALLGALIYSFPSKKLIVIGVTGTKGKSTVVHFAHEILQQTQNKVASVSSIRFKINDEEWKNMLKMTMPGRFKLQRFLKQALKAGCKYVILEITSEGIKQHRHRFIQFNGAVFTNLAKEHIEVHKGFENYKKAKGKLFIALNRSRKKGKFLIVNADDKHADYYSKLAGRIKKHEYSFEQTKDIEISLIGEFNKLNALAAINIGLALGISKEKSLKIIQSIKGVPGRMELIIKEPKVYVDYAHTPDSLVKVYQTIRKSEILNPKSEMICVLGSCGGGRDKWKRPEMGKIADKYCDKIILTNEDPYDENPDSILKDIESGFSQIQNSKGPNHPKPTKIQKFLDRREAIKAALSLAKKDDTIIITGKGSEPWMCLARGQKMKWDDREVAKEEFKKLKFD